MASFLSSERYQYILLIGVILCFVATIYVVFTGTQIMSLSPTYKGVTNVTTASVTDQGSRLITSGALKHYVINCVIKPTAGSSMSTISVVPATAFDSSKIVSQNLNITSSPDGSTTATPVNVFNQVATGAADTVTVSFLCNSTNAHTMTLDICTQ